MVSDEPTEHCTQQSLGYVLILVLMEDGLWLMANNSVFYNKRSVLILVLMEDGLWLVEEVGKSVIITKS